jgi:hypothetical protein
MKRKTAVKKKAVKKKVEPKKESSETKETSGSREKVFDVTPPGKSMPSSSSRPIIVSHKPSAVDPMVSPKPQNVEDDAEKPSAGEGVEMVMAAPKKNRIEPLHTDIVPDSNKAEELPQEEDAEPSESPAAEDKPEASSDSSSDSDNPENDDTKDEISDIASEVTTKKEVQSEAAKMEAEAAKRQAEVDALVNNKQYFVPINSVQKRRSMKFVIIVLLLMVVVIGVLAVLDAKLFDIGIKPPTDFI